MSADEFDPAIERLFARAPVMSDAALFTAEVESRLQKGSRIRSLVLAAAGVVGGAVAIRETLSINFAAGSGGVAGGVLSQDVQAASLNLQSAVQSGLNQLGLSDMGMSGMQLFWVAAGALIAVAAVGIMRLSQEV